MPEYASRQASSTKTPDQIRRRDAQSDARPAAAKWKKGQPESLAEKAAVTRSTAPCLTSSRVACPCRSATILQLDFLRRNRTDHKKNYHAKWYNCKQQQENRKLRVFQSGHRQSEHVVEES